MSPPQDKARRQITKLSKQQPDEMPTTKSLTVRAHPLLEGAVTQERASVALLGRLGLAHRAKTEFLSRAFQTYKFCRYTVPAALGNTRVTRKQLSAFKLQV